MHASKKLNRLVGFIRGRLVDLGWTMRTSPAAGWTKWLPWVSIYAATVLSIGFASGVYSVQLLDLSKFWYLPATLLLL